MIGFDPDKAPDLPKDAFMKYTPLGLIPICVSLDEPGAEPGDPIPAIFWAFVYQVPRVGEILWIAKHYYLNVTSVVYCVSPIIDGVDVIAMTTYVNAVRVSKFPTTH